MEAVKKRNDWTDTELAFLRDTYPDKAWSVNQIAITLDRSEMAVYYMAFSLRLSRPSKAFEHRHNKRFIADLQSTMARKDIVAKWGCSSSEVDRGRAKLKRGGV